MAKRGGLGKGLDALFLDNTAETGSNSIVTVRLSQVEPNSNQPRRQFEPEALQELADSIAEHGVLQPIVVRPVGDDGYQIIAGERRWRASRMAGLTEVPVIIREADDKTTMELALIENLQREDLNILEEAEGYKALMDLYGLTQEEAAKRLGKSRPVVANALRMLTLPEQVLELLRDGKLTAGHGRALVGLEESEAADIARKTVEYGLTVRDIEKLVKTRRQEAKKAPPSQQKEQPSAWGSSYCREAQLALRESLGRQVSISPKGEGGKLEIEFFSREDLNILAEALEKALKP